MSAFDTNTHPMNVYGLAPGTRLNPNGIDVRDLFGGGYSFTEPHNVIFDDRTGGFADTVVVVLDSPTRLASYNLFLEDDGPSGSRSARDFKLYAGTTLLDDVPFLNNTGSQNYTGVYGSNQIEISDTLPAGSPVSSRYTLVFVQNQSLPFGGVRAEEFDGFAAPTLPGDANGDGKVDFSDLLVLAQHYGLKGQTFTSGDFNGDGTVGFDDLLILAQNYGRGSTAAAVSAPEPAALAATAGFALLVPRRRHCRKFGIGGSSEPL